MCASWDRTSFIDGFVHPQATGAVREGCVCGGRRFNEWRKNEEEKEMASGESELSCAGFPRLAAAARSSCICLPWRRGEVAGRLSRKAGHRSKRRVRHAARWRPRHARLHLSPCRCCTKGRIGCGWRLHAALLLYYFCCRRHFCGDAGWCAGAVGRRCGAQLVMRHAMRALALPLLGFHLHSQHPPAAGSSSSSKHVGGTQAVPGGKTLQVMHPTGHALGSRLSRCT